MHVTDVRLLALKAETGDVSGSLPNVWDFSSSTETTLILALRDLMEQRYKKAAPVSVFTDRLFGFQ